MSNVTSCLFKILWSTVCFTSFLTAGNTSDAKENVFFINSSAVLQPDLMKNAITRNDWVGFYEDYLVLHCLIKKHQPISLFEIGTCLGDGTLIIKNAIGEGTVYSLDLPPGMPKQYHFLNAHTTGSHCTLPYIQLFGDSLTYDYTQHYPLDSWFIDGEHDYAHAFHESAQALASNPRACYWHDTEIPDIFRAVLDTFGQSEEYNVYRVVDTRVSYAIKKTLDN